MNSSTLLVLWLTVISVSVESNETGSSLVDEQDSKEGPPTEASGPMVAGRNFFAAQGKTAEAGNFRPKVQNLMPESKNSLQRDNAGHMNSQFGYENSPNLLKYPADPHSMTGNKFFMPEYNNPGYIPGHPYNRFSVPRYRVVNPRHRFSSPGNDFMSTNYDIKPNYDILDLKYGYSHPVSRPVLSGMPSDLSRAEVEKGFMRADPVITTNDNSRGKFHPGDQGMNSMNAGQYALLRELLEMSAQNTGAIPLKTVGLFRMDTKQSSVDAEIRNAQLRQSGSAQEHPSAVEAGGNKISNPQNKNLAQGVIRTGNDSEVPQIQLSQTGKYGFLALK